MSTIDLYDRASPFKRGAAVTVATFEMKSYQGKTAVYTVLAKDRAGAGERGNRYEISIPYAPQATLRITDARHGNQGEFRVANFVNYEFWL